MERDQKAAGACPPPSRATHRPGIAPALGLRAGGGVLWSRRPSSPRSLPMSRTPFTSRRPRGGTFRPQLEALEDRLPPGSLQGGPDHHGDDMAEHRREDDDLARMAAIRTTSGFVDFATHTIPLPGFTKLTRTAEGISAHFHATGLNAGHAYTFWIVEVQPNGFAHGGRVAGQVVGRGGVANVSVEAEVGEILGDFHVPGTPIQAAP